MHAVTFYAAAAAAMLIGGALLFSFARSRAIEAEYPNIGTLTDIGGYSINAVHVPRPDTADLPALVFIHGASGNLRDQMAAFRQPLEGRAEMLFVDRPGHGYSDRGGPENDFPDGQAAAIAAVMARYRIERAIVIGHSFGGAIAASFALAHPEKTAGLLFLAPATHPWPGGVAWYYHVASTPLVGWLFNRIVAMPAGLRRIDAGTVSVFAPNRRPDDYVRRTGPELVLRPQTFGWNATDVANLHAYVSRVAARYPEIAVPTVIITGDSDDIVLAEIHSRGLARDIAGSELLWIRGLGHKPDYIVTDVAIAALEKISGQPRDLQALAHAGEQRIAARP